jgi:hypothetical protein
MFVLPNIEALCFVLIPRTETFTVNPFGGDSEKLLPHCKGLTTLVRKVGSPEEDGGHAKFLEVLCHQ